MEKKFKEEIPTGRGMTEPGAGGEASIVAAAGNLDPKSLFENIRTGKIKDLWESLKNAGLTTIESISNFFLTMGNTIKEFLFGEKGTQGKTGVIPEPIQKVLTSMYEFIINAVKTALGFVSNLYKKGKDTLAKTITLPGGNEVKLHTIVALAAVGSIITLGIYKVVQAVRNSKAEEKPAEMEESIKATCEAFEKSHYLFKGLQNIKEEDDEGFAQDKISTLVEKASYVSNDVVNFADPNVEAEEGEDSKLVQFFKKFTPFVIIAAVAVALVVVGKRVFGEKIDSGLDIGAINNPPGRGYDMGTVNNPQGA